MPKTQEPIIVKARRYAAQFKREFSVLPSGALYCKLCDSVVNCERKSSVEKHRTSQKHTTLQSSSIQLPIQTHIATPALNNFPERVVKAFLSSDIPLNKLANPSIKELFKSLGEEVPSISACRSMVPIIANEQKQFITTKLADQSIFLIVDETDIRGSKYFNILAGVVCKPTEIYAIKCVSLSGPCCQQTVTHAIDDCLKEFSIKRESFLLLISDAARYMTAAGKTLKGFYPNMFHLTCVAHLVHNCAQKVKAFYPKVDRLIATVKAATLKCKERQQQFHPIQQPPQPIVTRWGSWLEAVSYYAENLPAVKKIVSEWKGSGTIVSNAREAVSDKSVCGEIVEIQRCYHVLSEIIQKFEQNSFTIRDASSVLADIDFDSDPCCLSEYLNKRLQGNSGLQEIMKMENENISPSQYNFLQNCPPSSAAVERSFSQLKNMMASNRPFLPMNVENYFLILHNKM